jgi:hypothetical protein
MCSASFKTRQDLEARLLLSNIEQHGTVFASRAHVKQVVCRHSSWYWCDEQAMRETVGENHLCNWFVVLAARQKSSLMDHAAQWPVRQWSTNSISQSQPMAWHLPPLCMILSDWRL